MTASVSISIQRPNGTSINARGEVPDELVVDIAATLSALVFEANAAPAVAETTSTAPATTGGS